MEKCDNVQSGEPENLPSIPRETAPTPTSSMAVPYLGSSVTSGEGLEARPDAGPLPDPRGGPTTPLHCLPQGYGQDCIALLVRDPDWVFAYWEVASPSPRADVDRYERAIRLYICHPIEGRRRVLDLTASSARGDWYINVPHTDGEYLAEVGYLYADGEFHPVACSNPVHTPPSSPSEVLDEEWMSVDCEFYRMYSMSVPGGLSGSEELIGGRVRLSTTADYLSSPFAHPSVCE